MTIRPYKVEIPPGSSEGQSANQQSAVDRSQTEGFGAFGGGSCRFQRNSRARPKTRTIETEART